MRRRRRTEKWHDGLTVEVDITPRGEDFVAATNVPTIILVGSNDLQELKRANEQKGGTTRLARAQLWVQAMRELALDNGHESKIELVTMQGKGHDMKASLAQVPKHWPPIWRELKNPKNR